MISYTNKFRGQKNETLINSTESKKIEKAELYLIK